MSNDVTQPLSQSLIETCAIGSDMAMSLYGAVALACIRNHGQAKLARVHYELGLAHQRRHFLDGIAKLNLGREATDAIRSAKYHYLTNQLAGLNMEYIEETPTKVWIRYRAPYYTFDSQAAPGTGLAAIQSDVGAAVFKAWHGNNCTYLNNRRLVFVHTQNAADGDPWDAGYFTECDEDVEPGDNYQRRPGEWGPAFNPSLAPKMPESWSSPERRAKSQRNFAIDWLGSELSTLAQVLGAPAAAEVTQHAYAVTLLQKHQSLAKRFGLPSIRSPRDAATFFARLLDSMGEDVAIASDGDSVRVDQTSSRLTRTLPPLPHEVENAISYSWRPLLRLWNTSLDVHFRPRVQTNGADVSWEFRDLR
jgi:hypothetical protein